MLISGKTAYTSTNEKSNANLHLGVSLLIVALVASLCLAVLPQKLTNEYGGNGVTHAATEVIDGITYEVIYLTGSTAENLRKISASSGDTGNYRYVLTENWDLTLAYPINFYGNAVILDLNGYTLTLSGAVPYAVFGFFGITQAELADSSAAGSGSILVMDNMVGKTIFSVTLPALTISGGNMLSSSRVTWFDFHNNATLNIVGGNFSATGRELYRGVSNCKELAVTVAPWMDATYDATGQMTMVKPYDAYTVSTTDLAPGAYNYAYAAAWDIDFVALRKLAIPTDKTYYLWARNENGRYEYLHCCYVDGAWRNAA